MQVSMQIALLERRSISELQEIWKKYFDERVRDKITASKKKTSQNNDEIQLIE